MSYMDVIVKPMRGTGGAAFSPDYRALANSGSVKVISLRSALSEWAEQHTKESYEAYTQFVRGAAGLNLADALDFHSQLLAAHGANAYLTGFDQFMAPNWDGDNATPVDKKDLNFARALLQQIGPYLPTEPDAAAGRDGSICMEWIFNSPNGLKKIFVDVTPGDQVLAFSRFGSSKPMERHFRKDDPNLVVYLQHLFDLFATK
jgi:hypothetical protein